MRSLGIHYFILYNKTCIKINIKNEKLNCYRYLILRTYYTCRCSTAYLPIFRFTNDFKIPSFDLIAAVLFANIERILYFFLCFFDHYCDSGRYIILYYRRVFVLHRLAQYKHNILLIAYNTLFVGGKCII